MDYRAAYEELSKAVWVYEKTHAEAWGKLMREVQRIESNLDKSLPPIQIHQPAKSES